MFDPVCILPTSLPAKAEKLNPTAYRFTAADHEGLAALADPRIVARFWSRVEKSSEPDGCWVWTGEVKRYGRFGIRARFKTTAHRFSFALAYGPIPDGLELDHAVCDNKPCVRSDHLVATTPRQNILRSEGPAAIYARRTHCPRGHVLVGENLVAVNTGPFFRRCRDCSNARDRAYSAANHDAVLARKRAARARRAARKPVVAA